jgi:hypothetical protein
MFRITKTCLLVAGLALAEETPATKPIPPDLTSEFYRTDGIVMRAEKALYAAQTNRDTTFSAMREYCAKQGDYSVGSDPSGNGKVVCVKKPEPAKK